MKYFITGGLGFIGQHLIDYLIHKDRNCQIFIFDNMFRGNVDNFKHKYNDKVKIIFGDIRNYNQLLNVAEKMDVVFHLAAQSNVMGSVVDSNYCTSTNIDGTLNVLKFAETTECKNFIFTSSREVYGEQKSIPVKESAKFNPKNIYGKSKVAGENLCLMFDNVFDINIFRLSNVYGSGDKDRVIPIWIDKAKKNEPLIIYGNSKSLDFVHISQVLEMITLPLKTKIESPMNVGSGQSTRLQDLAREIIELTGSNSKIEIVEERLSEVPNYVADVTKMKKVLGVNFQNQSLFALKDML